MLGHDFRENIALAEDLELLAVDFHFRAAVLPEDHFIADFHGEFAAAAAIEQFARSSRQYLAALRFFLGSIWQNNTASGHFFSFQRTDDNTIVEGSEIKFWHL